MKFARSLKIICDHCRFTSNSSQFSCSQNLPSFEKFLASLEDRNSMAYLQHLFFWFSFRISLHFKIKSSTDFERISGVRKTGSDNKESILQALGAQLYQWCDDEDGRINEFATTIYGLCTSNNNVDATFSLISTDDCCSHPFKSVHTKS